MTPSTRHCTLAPVIANREVAPAIFEMRLRASEIAAAAQPGQFVHLRVKSGLDPLLRRPLSIGAVEGEHICLLFRVIGHGTQLLSRVVPGETLDLLGPLGNPFTLHADRPAVLVAGGMGIADMPLLARRLREAGCPAIHLIFGARTAAELAWTDRVEAEGAQIHTATDDGSAGHHGVCTALLPPLLREIDARPAICACGPEPMFRAILSAVTDPAIPIQLAFEQRMGCGIGACMACAVETSKGYLRACCEGPVLDGALLR
ncbi:dihydroorotate dehydrogenase electron transfer subunit [Candidatus Sumerlaeota bacterium]|nr:dihydroorotate dehydrogenase electron transfer subunit [Candidatus Sumerlaeota bacterium]